MDLDEDKVVDLLERYFESLFPRDCPNCGRHFATLGHYILATVPVGKSVSYDAQRGDWHTAKPVGSAAFANCTCGSTLTLTTQDMALEQRLALLAWLKAEGERLNLSSSDVLDRLRARIRSRARETL